MALVVLPKRAGDALVRLWHLSDLTARTGDASSAKGTSPVSQGVRSSWSNNLLRESPCRKPPLDPDIADTAPTDSVLTIYDEEHITTYLRLLDADAQRAD
jgi:hypothetical protein